MVSFVRGDRVAKIKARLDHPVLDGDGHLLEVLPVVFDFVREEGGASAHERMLDFNRRWIGSSRGFLPTRSFHTWPAENTVDRMTAHLPSLLYERLDQLGIDFALIYPTIGLALTSTPDDELRVVGARALNRYYAECFSGLRDRLEPVAIIPCFTPEEAVAELDHAVGTLGLRAVSLNGVVPRDVRPDGTPATWVDTLGHDSLYDYDPVWAKCVELGVVPAFHGLGYGWGSRVSTRNYVHNHIGSFAATQEGVCRSLVMGGVAKRFPTLRFAFLEGGVTWAAQLLGDLIGHFDKRNKDAVGAYDDSRVDRTLAMELFDAFATGPIAARRERFERNLERSAAACAAVTDLDDFAESGITSPSDIVDMFATQFHFGCEADDPMNAIAFRADLLPEGQRLNALFASDISHWDVRDATEVLPEAWELVERGHITEEDFAAFTCRNVAHALTAMNPAFFDSTAVAGQAR